MFSDENISSKNSNLEGFREFFFINVENIYFGARPLVHIDSLDLVPLQKTLEVVSGRNHYNERFHKNKKCLVLIGFSPIRYVNNLLHHCVFNRKSRSKQNLKKLTERLIYFALVQYLYL